MKIIEKFADNGELSHYEIIELSHYEIIGENGELLTIEALKKIESLKKENEEIITLAHELAKRLYNEPVFNPNITEFVNLMNVLEKMGFEFK